MKLTIYLFALSYIQCGLGDPVIKYNKPPKALSMKDVLKYVTETSKVLEELAKEHLWLLSTMTGTNNWNDLLGGKPTWRKERVAEGPSKGVKYDSQRHDKGELESQDNVDGTTQIAETETEEKLENTSETEAADAGKVRSDPTDTTKTPEITSQTTVDKANNLHTHFEGSSNSKPHHTQISDSHTSPANQKMGYTMDIGHGDHPDPALNYLAWKDKPIHHQVDPYGKPIKDSDKLHTSEAPKPKSPPVLNTRDSDLVFSPLDVKQRTGNVAAKPSPSKVPAKAKPPSSPNPLAYLNEIHHQNKEEMQTLPKGTYNPLALVSSMMNDMDDFDDTIGQMLAESNLNSDAHHAHPDEAVKDPLAFPVQYYKPDTLPGKHSKSIVHPAHHSRLEVNDIGW